MQKEPTIHQLEKIINAFRINGGTDAELSAVAKQIIQEFSPERFRPIKEVFEDKFHPSIKSIHEFKKDPTPPIKDASKTLWSKKWFRYPFLFIVSFVIIFSLLNLPLVVTKLQPTKNVTTYQKITEVVQPEMEKSAALEPGEVIPTTSTIVVPKIGVTAPIQFINTNEEASIQEALRGGVTHYYGTAKPGEVGNTFITGHSSNYWWEKGGYNYVFANLNKLAVGDQAKIYYNGNKYVYQVKEVIVVEPSDVSVLNPTPTPTLTLMTCTPPGTNWKRLIVKFDQIAPKYIAPQTVEKTIPITTKQLPSVNKDTFLDWIAKIFNF